ncbi:MAG: ATP-binding cassette domain-containing protein [Flavobacteriales bacterium]|nr:ATP-binding cassette domain-containing protein [Flavobacteriales bacterium]MCX7767641.1 ATP-binding cassette domain-containing protein [Flavobacteriales bacterium]MDW8409517.1 ATP-binding cassette domain-containing protein [Flavobacteriales bacterium]
MIQVEGLSKSFNGRTVLQNIDALFEKGRVNLVIGRSGSGKTVFLKCLVGLLKPDAGKVYFDGRSFYDVDRSEQQTIRRELGKVFQMGALFDSMTVEENVRFPLEMFSGLSEKEKKDRVQFCLERVNLAHAASLYPSEISGGMRKRTAIARAIVNNPKYLLCDEPNSGLDPETAALIDELLLNITKEFQTTTIIVTHDMNSVYEIGEHVVLLVGGRKAWEGHGKAIFDDPNEALQEFVFSSEIMRRLRKA